jgi:Tfp pilus assembly protein PilX
MEEKMASNSQTATATFQKAESAIQQAFVTAQLNPPGAVADAIANIAAVNRTSDGITSSSRLNNPPNANITPLLNSSAGLFVARRMEIVGTANIGDISSTNIRGYRVFPLMQ